MKKFYALAAALILFAQGAGNCNDLTAMQKLADAFKDGTATPENSVLVYGRLYLVTMMDFYQMDSDFPQDIQKVEFFYKLSNSAFCLAPVAPGSYYMAGHFDYLAGNTLYWGYFPVQGSIWDFRAPSKPGLYYYGSYDFPESDERGERIAYGDQKKEELKCLKFLARHLKHTSWNDVIQKRIAELEGESK